MFLIVKGFEPIAIIFCNSKVGARLMSLGGGEGVGRPVAEGDMKLELTATYEFSAKGFIRIKAKPIQ